LREHIKINDWDINLDKDEFMKLYNTLTGEDENDFSIKAFMKDPKVDYSNNNFSLSKLKTKKSLTYDNNGHHFLTLPSLLK
jgi:hypothetical protein